MSSKFREGFLRLLGCKSVVRHTLISGKRKGTFHTTSTNLSSSTSGDKRKSGRIRDDSETMTASIIIKNGIEDIIMIGGDSEHSSVQRALSVDVKRNGFAKRKRSTFDDIDEIEEITPIRMHTDVGGGQNQMACGKKKKTDKEVLFSHQNGQNEASTKRRPSTSTAGIHGKSKMLSSVGVESSVDDTERYSTKYNASYTAHLDRIIVDENEKKLFLPQTIGTESFV